MKRLVFDIEADNLLWDVANIWCIVTKDIDTLEVKTFEPDEIEEGLAFLSDADVLIGHNIQGYDLPVLKKLYDFDFKGEVWDTLIGSRMLLSRSKQHSLKFWGEYLERRGMIKSGKQSFHVFTHYTPEMLEYCIQDVEVNYIFFLKGLAKLDFTHDSVRLEHDIVAIQTESETFGVSFAYEDAMKLSQDIELEMDKIRTEVETLLGYSWLEKEHYLKNDGELSKISENLLTKLQREFPQFTHKAVKSSGRCLIKVPTKITLDTAVLLKEKLLSLGWKCEWKTDKGSLQLTRAGEPEPNLSNIPGLKDVDIGKYYVLKHRLSIVSGFFKNVRSDGKIPSEANTLGAITGRYTHRKIANLPAPRSLYGMEIRSLFGVPRGYTQVGADLAGIEARILAHFMNDPAYTAEVLDGDIHTANQVAAGLPTRDSAKTFFYGFLYGAGDAKVGTLVGGSAKEGKAIKTKFLANLPSLGALIDEKQKEAEKGYVIALDGRKVLVTKSKGYGGLTEYDTRKALNTLLQSSATIFFKRWLWFVDRLSKRVKTDSHLMISYHDEGQWAVKDAHVERFKVILHEALGLTDAYYETKCKNDIDIKTGKNWGDCH